MAKEHLELAEDDGYVQGRRVVGYSLIGVGLFSSFHAVIWFVMRSWDVQWQRSFVGAEGLVVSAVIFLILGVYLIRTRSPA